MVRKIERVGYERAVVLQRRFEHVRRWTTLMGGHGIEKRCLVGEEACCVYTSAADMKMMCAR